jgi:archaellum component FlaF (FlaF/FlaG flagellin family)
MGFLIAFISMVVVFGLLLPIMGMMYLDILEAKQETKRQQEVMQRLINKTKEENDSNSSVTPR